jgi:hypothetical protein
VKRFKATSKGCLKALGTPVLKFFGRAIFQKSSPPEGRVWDGVPQKERRQKMEKRKLSTLTICHLVLLIAFGLASFVMGTAIVIRAVPQKYMDYYSQYQLNIMLYAVVNLLDALSLGLCSVYFIRGGKKSAAFYYKAFILTGAAVNAVSLLAAYLYGGVDIGMISIVLKIVLMLVLLFGKDMGKRYTWALFYVILAIDLLYAFPSFSPRAEGAFRLISLVSRILITGSIGLAIRAKYLDKAARKADNS